MRLKGFDKSIFRSELKSLCESDRFEELEREIVYDRRVAFIDRKNLNEDRKKPGSQGRCICTWKKNRQRYALATPANCPAGNFENA